jgi:hypothetical protein
MECAVNITIVFFFHNNDSFIGLGTYSRIGCVSVWGAPYSLPRILRFLRDISDILSFDFSKPYDSNGQKNTSEECLDHVHVVAGMLGNNIISYHFPCSKLGEDERCSWRRNWIFCGWAFSVLGQLIGIITERSS